MVLVRQSPPRFPLFSILLFRACLNDCFGVRGGPAFLHLVLVQERASAALLLPFAGAQRARRRWAAPDVDAVQELRRGPHVRRWACWLVLQLQLCGAIKFLT